MMKGDGMRDAYFGQDPKDAFAIAQERQKKYA